MDDSSYIAGGASIVSTNTKIATSQEDLAVVSKKTADAQVAAILKVREASKLRIAQLQTNLASASGFEAQSAATVALQREQGRLARTYGETTVATRGFSNASKESERDLNKLVRGGLAGSGALSALGRSLAFASTGFIAFATGATIIKASITAAQDEAVAQRQVATQLKTSGKSWKDYGYQIDSVLLKESHLAGFTKAELLNAFGYLVRIGGNVQKSLHLTALAADVARARSISLQSASIALAKALGGSATALRRLGIIVPKNVSTTQALAFVTAKFAGQAEAGTTASEKFHATLVDTGAVIGKALLPTFNRLAISLSNWLAKMNESGRLQKDVNTIVHDAGAVFHTLGTAIKDVDKVTGSFKNTLELVLALRLSSIVIGWVSSLAKLELAWRGVGTAATAAAGQEAVAAGAAAGAAGAAGATGVVARVGAYTAAGAAAARGGAGLSLGRFAAIGAGVFGGVPDTLARPEQKVVNGWGFYTVDGGKHWIRGPYVGFSVTITPQDFPQPGGSRFGPNLGTGFGPTAPRVPTIFASFTDTIANQLAQARAALTRSTKDDVAAAKAEIAFIKREIAAGHLEGVSLIQGLQAEASAVNVIQSAEAAAAAKRAAALQKAKAKIAAAIENSIAPLNLQVRVARDEANKNKADLLKALRALREAARKAIASGKLSQQQLIEAYNQITQLNQQIADATKKQAQAGRAAFKQLNLNKLTSGLNLTPAQRKALQARLSQIGPHGTVPGDGTGAYGYSIGANDRPIHVHNQISIDGTKVASNTTKHQQRRRRRNSSQRRGPTAGENG